MTEHKRILVTGGAGFIGSAVVRNILMTTLHKVLVVDKLTYAGNMENVASVARSPRFSFECSDISDSATIQKLLHAFRPNIIINLAAETHVDRSIDGPAQFIQTNLLGTYCLLDCALRYWRSLDREREEFRFHHVSTDEVFGSLGPVGAFTELSAYQPNSPYAASKAGADHLVHAWGHTFGLPCIVSNCSNNYGPYHFPEKLIPLMIINALEGRPLPVYGNGDNVRDWLYVDDHARALLLLAEKGRAGERYNIGGNSERTNFEVVRAICGLLDEICPDDRIGSRQGLITFVEDRPGHDKRYAIDASKVAKELGWKPQETFESGLRKTVQWFLENRSWWARIRANKYGGERLGVVS